MKTHQFNAFISYSQSADKRLATAIQNGLQSLGARKYALKFRALQIYRDETHGSNATDLKTKIERGLDESEYLIVIASPAITKPSGASKINWIAKEIEYWLSTKHPEAWKNGNKIPGLKIIICVAAGNIEWDHLPGGINDDNGGDFNWDVTTCLPHILSNRFTDEPEWILFNDIIEKEKENKINQLSLSFPDFKQKVATISARLQGKTVDQLIAKDRRAQRIWTWMLGVISIVLILISGSLVYNIREVTVQREEATFQKDQAEKESANAKRESARAEEKSKEAKAEAENAKRQSERAATEEAKAKREAELNKALANANQQQADSIEKQYNTLKTTTENLDREKKRSDGLNTSLVYTSKQTSLMNQLLGAENDALKSVQLNTDSIVMKREFALKAYDTFSYCNLDTLSKYSLNKSNWYDKQPVIYRALQEAYQGMVPNLHHQTELSALGIDGQNVFAVSLDGARTIFNKPAKNGQAPGINRNTKDIGFTPLHVFQISDTPYMLYSFANGKIAIEKTDPGNITPWNRPIPHVFDSVGIVRSIQTRGYNSVLINESGDLFILARQPDGSFARPRKFRSTEKYKLACFISDHEILVYTGNRFKQFSLSGSLLQETDAPAAVITLLYHSDKQTICAGFDQAIRLYDLKGIQKARPLNIGPKHLSNIMLSRDGSTLVYTTTDKTLYIHSLTDPREQRKEYAFNSRIRQIGVDDHDKLFVGLENGDVKYWPLHFNALYNALKQLIPEENKQHDVASIK